MPFARVYVAWLSHRVRLYQLATRGRRVR
ncbi:hypothetical protein MHPYR_170099 [uncultured Mycobacterium sp.]|uniref:Uncharacterized protein n=1 Tax=uncultured Mycobacterium sp. TaxID=171292 RepID=A0A1Y5PBV4_9MYCO|nr:hypothetical protein MHPYR_170099 [uncultured Mycobacterium sp.]